MTLNTKLTICQLLRNRDIDDIQFLVANMQQQQDTCSFGLFVIAVATNIIYNNDPTRSHWDIRYLRKHLLESLEARTIPSFPKLDSRFVSKVYHTTVTDKLYCKCKQVINPKRSMVLCKTCKKWYHMDCMSLDSESSYDQWVVFHVCNLIFCNFLLFQVKLHFT